MWVCYFRSVGSTVLYQYKAEYVSPSYSNDQRSYNIDLVEFDEEKFKPVKLYQQNDQEVFCFVSKITEDSFSIDNFLSPIIEFALKFCPDSQEEVDKKYSEESYPLCDATHYQASRDLVNSLRKTGIKVVGYKHLAESYLQIKVSSDSISECITDVEFCRFFSTSVFRNVLGKFVIPRRRLKGSAKVSFIKKENFLENLNEDLVSKINDCEDRVELVFDKPDLNFSSLIPRVLSAKIV
tara:strand:- start:263 stop:976 length:714 start_codon:yes stop_codon:yes gene_type:complete